MYLPTTAREVEDLGWNRLDVILVTGDGYIDSPYIGAALIGKVLMKAGYRVGIIAQPDVSTADDISRLGEPRLFWGVTAGSLDSMVANRTASGKKRKTDDYTPGGINNRRPDRASIAYSNLIRKYFKGTAPIVLGGIEASLRRIAHYDFWTDKIRRSILFDARADYLLFGMAERTVREFADCLQAGGSVKGLPGICYISDTVPPGSTILPSFEDSARSKETFTRMFHLFYRNSDPLTSSRLAQLQDTRYLIQNPPAPALSSGELDSVFEMDFERDLHPYYREQGRMGALETIRNSVTTHRGCYGECNFCAITVHQGRTVSSRSEESIVREVEAISQQPGFKGTIYDVGGPTANMYGFECEKKLREGACTNQRCLFPEICERMAPDHSRQISLFRSLRRIRGVKRVLVASGVRYDLVLGDREHGERYLEDLLKHHVSGQMKIAPEHVDDRVLELMGKPGPSLLLRFRKLYYSIARKMGKKQHLSYYFMAAHPGCSCSEMESLKSFARENLKLNPRQVQIYTPSPSTYSALMYWTERDPFTGEKLRVEKGHKGRDRQKNMLVSGTSHKRVSQIQPGGKDRSR